MSYDYYGIIIVLFLTCSFANSYQNIKLNNVTFGHIDSSVVERFQSQDRSCSWIIHNNRQQIESYYIVSFRRIQLVNDSSFIANELVIHTDKQEIILDNHNQRTFYIPTLSASLEIYFRPKSHYKSLNIYGFFLEFIHIKNNNYDSYGSDYFHCKKSGLILPKQWQCNCLHECLYDDYSDEENCPLCSMIQSTSDSLLCHSNETWCLPTKNRIDQNGICMSARDNSECSYSTKCESVISFYKDHGEIILNQDALLNRESLCFVIITKASYKLKFMINQFDFLNRNPDLEFLVYDGSEKQDKLLISSNMLLLKQTVQTREHHLATIIIRKRSTDNINNIVFTRNSDRNDILFNITWVTSVCPFNHVLCNSRYEIKCYSINQRCDGIWDCISGDDELGCLSSSCPTTFSCQNSVSTILDQPRCFNWYERCNGKAFCENGADEKNCTDWWCNSNNGTFLCKNLNCIYETWVCDGTNDCGDNSDEIKCPFRISRRILTASVVGFTICSTLLVIALGCACKLLHLRSAEQRASLRLLNPQEYIQRRRDELQRQFNPDQPATNEDAPRIAPPSYNQTMGFTDDAEERHALLAEYLRLAGLGNFISLPSTNSHSRHRSRRHRRHRHRHHSHHHRTERQDPDTTLSESNTLNSNSHIPTSIANGFHRMSSRFRSLFTRNLSINNNIVPSDDVDILEHLNSLQSLPNSTRSCIEFQELPPVYADEPLLSIHDGSETPLPTAVSTSTTPPTLFRTRKRQMPLNTLCDHLEEQQTSSLSLPMTTIRDDEQASSDDDDKLLLP